MIAQFNDVEIPNVSSEIINRKFIGDRVRLAGGKMHQDYIAVKRTWELEAQYITKAKADAIIDELVTSKWKVDFWLDELDSTVAAYVNVKDEERVQFSRDGVWHNDGRTITFEVVEE